MNKNQILATMSLILLASTVVNASVIDVCDLSRVTNFPAQFTQSQITEYQNRIQKECELSTKFKSVNQKLQAQNQINLTDIAEYQAIRFVERAWLNIAASDGKPVEKIYQISKSQYGLPISQQSGDIWDDWANGVRQLEPMIEAFKQGQSFNLATLKKIHRGLFPFYPMIDEHGEFAHEPNPGVLKPTTAEDDDIYWWTLDTAKDVVSAQNIVNAENQNYQSLGLIAPVPKGMPAYVGYVLNVRDVMSRDNPGQKVTGLFSGSSVVNRQSVELVLNMVDQLIKQARSGNHMVWKDKLFSPAQLAYFVQQFYVRVHPFYEGNGRTSRFLQELILSSFNLPHGASGDLMDIDALTEHNVYYQTAIDANFVLLTRMERCLDEYKDVARRKDIRSVDQSLISYSCRVLADRSPIWAQLKSRNEVTNADKFNESEARLKELDRQATVGHDYQLSRRKAIESGKTIPVAPTAGGSSSGDDCTKLSGSEKIRCETFAEILKKIGK